MKILVLGASGATGRLVVAELIRKNIQARIVIRENAALPEAVLKNDNVEIVKGSIDDFKTDDINKLLYGCNSVVCCLGHNITFKGILGKPRKLVYNAVKKITEAINNGDLKIKLILMSTTAFTYKRNERNSTGERIVFTVLEKLLPPHRDNMDAARYLIDKAGINGKMEWAAVRPDGLINENEVSAYEIVKSPVRSPIFNAGKTSRINVAAFMVELLCNDELWEAWKFKFPVIYNKGS